MSFVRSIVRNLAETPVGQRLRTTLGVKPPLAIRPMSAEEAVSDLFPWRVDAVWDTRFDLTNVPSMILPGTAPTDTATVVVFTLDGTEIARRTFTLEPFEVRPILLRDFVGSHGPAGTFSVFHDAGRSLAGLHAAGCSVAERGYLCFKRQGDALWGVVHGNLHGLSMRPGRTGLGYLAGRLHRDAPYRVPVRFDDVDRFELTFANPTPVPQRQILKLLDDDRGEVGRIEQVIQPRGVGLFSVDNHERKVTMVEGTGRIAMWRPAIFKYYASHYNILHA